MISDYCTFPAAERRAGVHDVRARLDSLTSLRFLAAAMIVFEHARVYGGPQYGWAAAIPWDQGVSFFFVLSGFILTYTYPAFETPTAIVRFWVARVARVWPLHAVTAIIVLTTLTHPPASTPVGATAVVTANLVLVQSWVAVQHVGYSLNGASWSLSTEWFFYLLFPLLVIDWRRTWYRKLGLSLAMVVAVLALGNMARGLQESLHERESTTHAMAYLHPFARLFEFTLGMAGYLLWRRLSEWTTWTPLAATVAELGATALTAYWLANQPVRALLAPVGGPTGVEWAAHSGACVVFALLVPVMATGRGAISRALACSALVLLGEISYSLYLTHGLVLRLLAYEFPGSLAGLTVVGWTLLWLLVTGVALLSWRFVELPARRWILDAWDARAAEGRTEGRTIGVATTPRKLSRSSA